MKFNLLLMTLMLPLAIVVSGQTSGSQEKTNIAQTYDLDDESEDKEYLIQVHPGATRLMIRIQAELIGGSLEAVIFHPEGSKDGQLNLTADGSGGKSKSSSRSINDKDYEVKSKVKVKGQAKGNFEKQFTNPEAGTWKIKIKLNHADGHLQMISNQN